MVRIINNLMEIERGEQYFKDHTGEIKISCKIGAYSEVVIINDLKTKKRYVKDLNEEIPSNIQLKNLIKRNGIETALDLIKIMEEISNTIQISPKVFNPFFKEITGIMEFKLKNGKFTKAQIKKILKHKDTIIIRESEYTDDYYADYLKNYNKGVEISKIDMLKEVEEDFKSACDYKDGEINIFTVGYSHLTKIKNKNIKIVA